MGYMEHARKAGIYGIFNTITGKYYVGSTIGLAGRWYNHRSALRRGTHDNTYLQRAWVKYGEIAFEFRVLHLCSKDSLAEQEGIFIQKLNACDRQHGYNLTPIVNGRTVVSDATRAKLSAANKGKTRSPEQRARISAAKTGVALCTETRQAMSAAHTGMRHSPETLAKYRGKHHTEETKAKISAWHTGKVVSDETKEKIRAAQVGRPSPSPEAREKMSAASKGRKFSEEHKAKLSDACKRRWAAKRNKEPLSSS